MFVKKIVDDAIQILELRGVGTLLGFEDVGEPTADEMQILLRGDDSELVELECALYERCNDSLYEGAILVANYVTGVELDFECLNESGRLLDYILSNHKTDMLGMLKANARKALFQVPLTDSENVLDSGVYVGHDASENVSVLDAMLRDCGVIVDAERMLEWAGEVTDSYVTPYLVFWADLSDFDSGDTFTVSGAELHLGDIGSGAGFGYVFDDPIVFKRSQMFVDGCDDQPGYSMQDVYGFSVWDCAVSVAA